MLDRDTKRKIDSARNILVGKVPDPKAQVEQITTALIYKFMDDMDRESQELGGKAEFFSGDFEKYGWSNLLDKRLSGAARRDLFVEAITNMPNNPHIPQIFRDMFKGAFLPYNDPETLSLFLKEINWFIYDHSENLGNAFEYLLSVLGSQGDAGQFRTPRHIIDFIVAVVDPGKDETILDPACGTAGFLISAYKHILAANKKRSLTPAQKTRLMDSLTGYDIAPDMVKLSLVNMYLHGFQIPKIFEYDTLTSEERWGEQFKVILANPPFMTPTGGIRPHQRFFVQAKRAEVLFVAYIIEHLSINGRAGIIVPEGVIFKKDSAYKQLRKLLVENSLSAVVSLPTGVFNPYSGEQTSILFLDNQFSKKTDKILFLTIQNDGFDLGKKRLKINENDLPEALQVLTAWNKGKKKKSNLSFWVKKEKIAESGDYSLVGSRYRKAESYAGAAAWPKVRLGDVLAYEQPTKYIVKSVDYKDEYKTPVLTAGQTFVLGHTNEKDGIFRAEKLPVIIFDDFTTATKFVDFPFKVKSSAMKILSIKDKTVADIMFVFSAMRNIKFDASRHKRYWIAEYSKLEIPLPPLEVQRQIVEQIEVKQNAINHAKKIIENLERERLYFGQKIRRLDGLKPLNLGDIAQIGAGNSAPQDKALFANGKHPFCRTADVGRAHISARFSEIADRLNDDGIKGMKLHRKNTILFPKSGASTFLNHRVMLAVDSYVSAHLATIYADTEKVLPDFLFNLLISVDAKNLTSNQNYPSLRLSEIASIQIPLPPLDVQARLVAETKKEEEIIAANRGLIGLMDAKINEVISEI